MDVIRSALRNESKVALITRHQSFRFRDLLNGALHLSQYIQEQLGLQRFDRDSGKYGPRVGVMFQPGEAYVASTWATWLTGGIAVPLAVKHTPRELEHVIKDSGVSMVLTSRDFRKPLGLAMESANATLEVVGDDMSSWTSDHSNRNEDFGMHVDHPKCPKDGALIIYTSGTTGRPKGVLHTHKSLHAQMRSLSMAWGWHANDCILHALPLHHIHGIVNALYCAHYNGACIVMQPKFSPRLVWEELKAGRVNVFMGVPTMYSHLICAFNEMSTPEKAAVKKAAGGLRLYVSGSSACPVPIMQAWEEITGHRLLERYGMTEIGMALSNPLNGERRPGFVGEPLPGVSIKDPPHSGQNDSFELCVKGDTLFEEYWGNADATKDAFDEDGYFRTGDTVKIEGSPPCYKILGRTSVDIIKFGGYKLSALEIESVIMENDSVLDCSVVGLPDEVYGQVVGAVVVASGEHVERGFQQVLEEFCKEKMADYKVPRRFWFLEAIPRNAMGKVDKKQLVKDFPVSL